jgi:transcription antitermination protein NusB
MKLPPRRFGYLCAPDMISRRSIRIKVMQALYMKEKDPSMSAPQLLSYVDKQLDSYHRLYLLNLFILAVSARYVNEMAQIRAAKHIKTKEDLEFSVRLFHNPIVQNIVLSKAYEDGVKKEKLEISVESDLFRKVFMKFSESPDYQHYASKADHSAVDDFRALTRLYNHFIANDEPVESVIEELIPSWHDDKQAIVQMVGQTLRQIADNPDASAVVARKPSDETEVKRFAKNLIETFLFHEHEYSELIKPKLKNWDEDRIAEMDMLLIKLGLTEFLYLEDIPVKVTINEYLEIAKLYSTPQSKDFINGILDSILKDLREQNKLRKVGRGAVEG